MCESRVAQWLRRLARPTLVTHWNYVFFFFLLADVRWLFANRARVERTVRAARAVARLRHKNSAWMRVGDGLDV